MGNYNSREETVKHMDNVKEKLKYFIGEIYDRGRMHDTSKLESPEKEIFDEYTPKLKGTTYGSDEYKEYLKEMKVALDHHYANNRHHPEHFENGINDMTLVDLVEMFADWNAASERHGDGDMMKSIDINAVRFGMSDQLKQIFINTIKAQRGESNE